MIQSENNTRIAKNTLVLYLRMLVSMPIMLYTSRVVLNTLGIEDYGIYNVVGGVVSLFSCLSGSMVSATQRFMTFEIGRGDNKELNSVFSCSLLVHLIISLLIIVVSEPIGLWFITHKMVIPPERLYAACWVFHLSVLALFGDLLYIPYNALVVSYERMKAFAYISIVNVSLKLLVALLLTYSPMDKLVFYASLMSAISFLSGIIYWRYCYDNFEVSRFHYSSVYTALLKRFWTFASYSFIGDLAIICYTQGTNILLNLFFGPVVNAARGISVQVQGAISSFSGNFQMALNPQITKSYAQGDLLYMQTLVCYSSKYSFYLLFLFSFPIMLETHLILKCWLGKVPEYSVAFVRLMLCISIVMAMANPITRSVHSTGNIKSYQLFVGGGHLLILPISYGILLLGLSPQSVFVVALIVFLVIFMIRLYFLKSVIHIKYRTYFNKVIYPIIKVLLCSIFLPLLVIKLCPASWYRIIYVIFVFVVLYLFAVYRLGMDCDERSYLKDRIIQKINNK